MSKYIGTKAVNLSTTSADVTGNADIDGNLTVGGNLTVSGTTITVDHATAQTVDLGDGDKIRLGDGNDLQIYHDGTHSRIVENNATGQLKIQGNNMQLLTSDGTSTYLEGNASTGAVTLYHLSNAPRIATTPTGIDVTGTVFSDNMQIEASTSDRGIYWKRSSDNWTNAEIRVEYNGNYGGTMVFGTSPTGALTTTNTDRLKISNNGDISFYDTSGNVKFFWDASAEKVEIAASGGLKFTGGGIDQDLVWGSDATDYAAIRVDSPASQDVELAFHTTTSAGADGTPERVRINSVGSLLVGTNNADIAFSTSVGSAIQPGGQTHHSATGTSMVMNRTASDGTIAQFRKGGVTIGEIGVKVANSQGRIYLGNSNTKLLFDNGADRIYPVNNDGNARNAAIDLGLNGAAFKDLYLTGGIQFDSRSNKLDDYEEGTWNPNPRGATTAGTYSLQYRLGTYVKVGNMVQCDCTLFVTSFTGTGDFEISGLPFSSASSGSGGLVLVQWNECPFATYSSSDQHVVGLIPANQSYIHFRASDHNQGGQLTQLQCGNSNITYLRLSMTYKTN